MRNIDEIIINKAAISILDKENSRLVLSDSEIELTEDNYSYLEKHILRILKNDDARAAVLKENNMVSRLSSEIYQDQDNFIANSKKLAQFLYKCISCDEHEVSGDFIVCLFESQTGNYLALMKLDFTETYSHFHHAKDSEKSIIGISMNKVGLPGPGQKVSKAIVIKESNKSGNFRSLVIDKDVDSIFINSFLKCEFVRDRLENAKILRTIAERFARRAFKDNAQEAERFRQRMAEHLANEDKVNIDKLADESFSDAIQKNEFKAVIVSEGITEKDVPIDKEWAAKKLQRKRLKIDKSIELYIDSEAYKDKDKFQIKRNGDGTIDIILKNVRNYIEK